MRAYEIGLCGPRAVPRTGDGCRYGFELLPLPPPPFDAAAGPVDRAAGLSGFAEVGFVCSDVLRGDERRSVVLPPEVWLAVAACDFAFPVAFDLVGVARFVAPSFLAAGFCAFAPLAGGVFFVVAAGLFELPLDLAAASFWPGAVSLPRATPFPGTSTPLGAV